MLPGCCCLLLPCCFHAAILLLLLLLLLIGIGTATQLVRYMQLLDMHGCNARVWLSVGACGQLLEALLLV
jgi:hypothetical protein